MNSRISNATMPRANTLAHQISASQPRRCSNVGLEAMPAASSVKIVIRADLAAKDVVRHGGVRENDRDGQQRADQCEAQTLRRAGSFPDGDVRRQDVGPDAD